MSKDTCTIAVMMVPALPEGDISFHVFFFRAARFLFVAIGASFRCFS